ncbi:Pls/PosA family non-ribosomal peptide synthetase [Actinomadura sp. 7K507]|uniref:Pls/PosA family non-ribosomal peptide synthetase n=1 Tax=Actinomadura sp. 7K507 TaxID=2530365 RepID=UPI00104C622D|nr:Pls/PosA family non-ribosomal peptide synthetase [Actinomadura sp. 7K507]TDC88755.1 amino acid adenylation domain-containing protein [Actinomadura sp. 7K507]
MLRPLTAGPEHAVFRSRSAPPERTLLDVLDATVLRHPYAPALDDGTTRLDYEGLRAEAAALAKELEQAGVGRGDRVGIRVPSGTADLYIAVLAVLAAGAAYVPVDADDPAERAATVFGEAGVCAVIGEHRELTLRAAPGGRAGRPEPGDDAWIIFTSGSTGRPKGVAVSHRAAAAFVDAEARLFPARESDRVLAGLSVAFDASCEEMWLAWRHGACLVPAPRSLVRTGADLGPWLAGRGITVVSTVPTLAALWPPETLDGIRLLIFGGEACPPELAARLAVPGRRVWNTYGPTEATVVACAAPLGGTGPVRIGLPLDGWDLAVVDPAGEPVAPGGTGELVIGGVGLARYLDPAKDAEKYGPLPSLGWERAYRSGDLVRADPAGLVFVGRADDQIKLGGRRIELGEVDAALQALPGVTGAAAAVRETPAGHRLLVGYLVTGDGVTGDGFDAAAARERLAEALPAALVPRLVRVDTLPTRTSGKVDRDALPWPMPGAGDPDGPDAHAGAEPLSEAEERLAAMWAEVLGESPAAPGADFFALGGGSLAAARLVSALRPHHPSVSVGDVYENPTLRGLAAHLGDRGPESTQAGPVPERAVRPVPARASAVQALLMIPLLTAGAMRWVVGLAALGNLAARYAPAAFPWAPAVSWWAVLAGALLFAAPPGRMALAAAGARLLLRGLRPGTYPRGGAVHLRLWTAEQLAARLGAAELSAAPWLAFYARALGARIGPDVDLHTAPPVTGMLWLGRGAAIEPEADLSGHWLDGDVLHVGEIRVGADAVVGARAVLFPGARVGKKAQVAAGSAVTGRIPAGQRWAGAPAVRRGKAKRHGDTARPPRRRRWTLAYGVSALGLSLLPLIAALPGLAVLGLFVHGTASLGDALPAALASVPLATLAGMSAFAAITLACVRLLGLGLREGEHPVHSRQAWQAWATSRLMAAARVWLFPLYASVLTPAWLRALGMRVGRDVEASTVLALPTMTSVDDGAFLADDTMVAAYELGGGRMRIARARIGKRAFLGNSGMTGPGRKVPKGGLIGVLSAAPKKAKAGASYLGMPPVRLSRRADTADQSRTYRPSRRLKAARAAVEACRVVPAMCTVAVGVLAAAALAGLAAALGAGAAALLGGAVLTAAGVLAAAVAAVAKWALVGRITPGDRALWSSFVWRNELADNFVEVLAAPWFAEPWLGTAPLNLWLRSLGARIGRGVWCATYWLPEADLVRLGDGACVNEGCVLQTHLFHDRIMRVDSVVLDRGATLGSNGVILPAASIGACATVGPASLVMRGEQLPAGTRWLGNPIAAWTPAAADRDGTGRRTEEPHRP